QPEAAKALTQFQRYFRSDEQRRQVASWCGEVLLAWAETEAHDQPAGVRQALALLGAAETLYKTQGLPVPRTLYLRLAQCLAVTGDDGGAAIVGKQAERPAETALDHFVLGLQSHQRGQPKDAIAHCEKALALEPSYFPAEYLAGLCQMKIGKWVYAN